jgi:hypothetical protein
MLEEAELQADAVGDEEVELTEDVVTANEAEAEGSEDVDREKPPLDEADEDRQAAELADPLLLALPLAHGVCVEVPELHAAEVAETEPVDDRETRAEALEAPLHDDVTDAVTVKIAEVLGVILAVEERDSVSVAVSLKAWEAPLLSLEKLEKLEQGVGDALAQLHALCEGETLKRLLRELEAVKVGDTEVDDEVEADPDTVLERVPATMEAVLDFVPVTLAETHAEGVLDLVEQTLPVTLALAE